MKAKKGMLWTVLLGVLILIVAVVLIVVFARKKPVEGEVISANAPDIVLEGAKEYVSEQFEWGREAETEAEYSTWRIENLEHVYTYDDFDGMCLEVYLVNFRYKADSPDKVVLAGGREIDEEGWVIPDYPSSHHLIYERKGEQLKFVTALFENDCRPGDEPFSSDLHQVLDK